MKLGLGQSHGTGKMSPTSVPRIIGVCKRDSAKDPEMRVHLDYPLGPGCHHRAFHSVCPSLRGADQEEKAQATAKLLTLPKEKMRL